MVSFPHTQHSFSFSLSFSLTPLSLISLSLTHTHTLSLSPWEEYIQDYGVTANAKGKVTPVHS